MKKTPLKDQDKKYNRSYYLTDLEHRLFKAMVEAYRAGKTISIGEVRTKPTALLDDGDILTF